MAFAPARVAPVVAQRLQIPLQVLLYVGLFIFAQYLVYRYFSTSGYSSSHNIW